MRIVKPLLALAVGAALLAGCSSPKHEPAKLVKFDPAITVNELWSVSLSNPDGFLQPAVSDGSVWAAGGKKLTRLSASDGKVEWTLDLPAVVTAGVGSDGYDSAVGLEDGTLVVVNGDGKIHWQKKLTTELAGPPVITQGLVIVRTRDTRITAFEISSGDAQWNYQRTQPALTVRVPTMMASEGPLLMAGLTNGHVALIDIASGRQVFEFSVAQPSGITEVERLIDVVGAPALNEDLLCAAAYQGGVTCVNSRTGQLRWRQKIDAVAGPAIDADNVYVVDAIGKVNAYYRESGELRWTNDKMTYRGLSAPVIFPGAVAVGDDEGYVHFLSPRTGVEVGRTRLSGAIVVKAQASDNGAVYQTTKGEVAALATR